MKGIATFVCAAAALSLAGCGRPAGKADLKADRELRAKILAECADGTHTDPQECSNAKAIENEEKLDRSLGSK
ncbi:hypothetical protein AYR46_20070 [Sphingobium yanoikuyae]|uniref:EexN family lipoprotein n=1 Tax=Sphingobium yanoikuyae TaxID=13690 RepID=UPI0007A767AF|nr:EexN family lipoprotein [Sphingobium yanoikuyae]KZC75973.1 hypothetical protein AYR46_20070 [Sphingobium yanoikuyae]